MDSTIPSTTGKQKDADFKGDNKGFLLTLGGIFVICIFFFSGRGKEEAPPPAPAPASAPTPAPAPETKSNVLGQPTANNDSQAPQPAKSGNAADSKNYVPAWKSNNGVEAVEVVPSKRALPKSELPKSREILIDREPKISRESCDAIEYPKQSLRNEETGTTVVGVLVSAYGTPLDTVIEKSSGYRLLDNASKKNVMTCRFNAALRENVPYQDWVKIEYLWKLD